MEKKIKISNKVTDLELVKIIKDYEEEGYSVRIDGTHREDGYVELIIK